MKIAIISVILNEATIYGTAVRAEYRLAPSPASATPALTRKLFDTMGVFE